MQTKRELNINVKLYIYKLTLTKKMIFCKQLQIVTLLTTSTSCGGVCFLHFFFFEVSVSANLEMFVSTAKHLQTASALVI